MPLYPSEEEISTVKHHWHSRWRRRLHDAARPPAEEQQIPVVRRNFTPDPLDELPLVSCATGQSVRVIAM